MSDAEYENGPSGVGGWLLLLCLGLTVFSPLSTLRNLVSGYDEASPYFGVIPGFHTIFLLDTPLSVGLMIFSIYAGTGLWSVRKGAVQTAKTYLLCLIGYSMLAMVLPYLVDLPAEVRKEMVPEMLKSTVRGAIFAGVWFAYLSNSQRVRNTYSH